MTKEHRQSIGSRAVKGLVWAYGSYVGGRLLVLLATAILARLLTKSDFGLVALALTFTGLLDTLSNLGLAQALIIQKDEDVYERAETVFLGSVAISLVLTVLIAAFSPLIASFFGNPELVGIVAVLGVNFFLRSLGVTHYALAQRTLDFRSRTIAEIADAVVRGAVGIGLALAGFGAWSLVLGYLVGTIALDVAIWICVPWRPKWRPRRAHLPHLLRFGGTLSAVDVTAALSMAVDNLFVARVLGASALGLYSIAFRIPQLAILNMSVVASTVLFPTFSAQARDVLGRAFLTSVRYVWMITLPLATMLILLADPLIEVVFGPKWAGAVVAMQIVAVYAFAFTVGFPAGDAYKATGRVGVILILTIARLAILVVALVLFISQGIAAAAACQAVSTGIIELIGIVLASRLLSVSLFSIMRQIWPAIAATAAMALPIIGLSAVLDAPLALVVSAGLAGTAAYVLVIAIAAPDTLRNLRSAISSRGAPQPPDEPIVAPDTDVVV